MSHTNNVRRWTVEAKFMSASTISISLEICTIDELVSTIRAFTGEIRRKYSFCDDQYMPITTDTELREAFRNARRNILVIFVQPSQPSSQILPSEYVSIKARGHVLRFGGEEVKCPGQEFNTGAYTIPFKKIDLHRVLNLADLFFPASGGKQIWDYGNNHSERVTNFFAIADHWQYVLEHDYFMAPIDKSKLRRWRGTNKKPKVDVPNLTLATFSYLLNHFPREVINIDPLSSLCEEGVRATNLSVVARHITTNITPSTLTGKINIGPGEDTGTEYINFQRGTGKPSPTEYQQLHRILPGMNILQVLLAPGKYNREGSPVTCYEGFSESVAQLANQFTDLPIYCKFEALKRQSLLDVCPPVVADVLPRLRALYLVLDEFSGYAMYYAAILKGFGLEHVTRVLCFNRGKYEDTSLLHGIG